MTGIRIIDENSRNYNLLIQVITSPIIDWVSICAFAFIQNIKSDTMVILFTTVYYYLLTYSRTSRKRPSKMPGKQCLCFPTR